ncbi:MAG: outer membrane protein assembly factor BamB [Porticoccaceae bacterium]|nr:outer membrane protein assembly factor BamB [Porticoccaceae bacterium]
MKKLALLCCVLLLSGCSSLKFWQSDEDKALQPAKLEKITAEVKLRKVWSRNTGSGQDPLYASLEPAFDDTMIVTADGKGRVMAMDRSSGRVLWNRKLDRPLSGGVGLGGGLVLVGDLRGNLFALEAASGDTRWRARLNTELLSVPAASKQVVVIQALDARLVGLSPLTGEILWQYTTDAPALTLRGTGNPIIAGTSVITGFANGKVVSLNAATGATLWENRVALPTGRTELERIVDIDGAPLLVGDVVFVTSYQGRAAAITRGTGTALWYQDMSSHHGPAHGDGQVYVSNDRDAVVALRANSGQVLWSNEQLSYRGLTAPAFVDGVVVVGDSEGYLHVLSPVDGRFIGRDRADRKGLSVPMASDGDTLYVLTNRGRLTAYQVERR